MNGVFRAFFGCLLTVLSFGAIGEVYSSTSNIYYVSPAGNDNNAGTSPAASWQTLEKINSRIFQPGDVILFQRGGEWYGQINVRSSGVTYSAYDSGDKPVIHGWKTLSGWTNEGGGLYSTTNSELLETVNILTINGEVRNKGRFPKNEWHPITSVHGNNSINSNELSGSPDYTGANIAINKNSWIIDVGEITNHSGRSINYRGTSAYLPSQHYGFFIFNHIGCLTEFGDWMYESTNKKLTMYFGSENPNNHSIKVSSVEDVIMVNGRRNIIIDGLSIQGSNRTGIRFSGSGAVDNVIKNCDILKSGFDGVYLDKTGGFPDGLTIDNCLFEDTKNQGIDAHESRNITVTNNVLRRTFLDPAGGGNGDFSGVAISLGATGYRSGNYTVTGNKIYDSGYNGIRFSGSNVLIEKNVVSRYNLTKIDGGGIYCYGKGNSSIPGDIYENRIIRRNIVSNKNYVKPILTQHPGEVGFGIYIDDKSRNVICENNILYENSVGLYIHNARDIKIRHNLIYKSRSAGVAFDDDRIATSPDGDIVNIDFQYNIIYSLGDSRIFRIHNQFGHQINLGIIDNNYFIKPTGTVYIEKHQNWSDYELLTLDEWKRTYKYDLNTKRSPTTSDVSAIFYNSQLANNLNFNIGSERIDIDGNIINEKIISLEPFESVLVLGGEPSEYDTEPISDSGFNPASLVNIFPNPSSGLFQVEVKSQRDNQQVEIFIFDTSGRMVFQTIGHIAGEYLRKEMDLSFMPKGLYFVNVIEGSYRVAKRLIFQ